MESIHEKWSLTTKKIYQGVLFYALGGIIYDVFDTINNWGSGFSDLMSLAEKGSTDIGFLDVLCWIILAGVIYGYYLYMTGLKNFRTLQKGTDEAAVGKIYTAVILAIIAAICYFIPLLGLIGAILDLIAFIMMLMAFSSLKDSTTFPALAKEGANTLFKAMMLTIVGIVLGIIPFVGWILKIVLDVISFFMIIKGWALIRDSSPKEESSAY